MPWAQCWTSVTRIAKDGTVKRWEQTALSLSGRRHISGVRQCSSISSCLLLRPASWVKMLGYHKGYCDQKGLGSLAEQPIVHVMKFEIQFEWEALCFHFALDSQFCRWPLLQISLQISTAIFIETTPGKKEQKFCQRVLFWWSNDFLAFLTTCFLHDYSVFVQEILLLCLFSFLFIDCMSLFMYTMCA